jgi:hypothetical protein
VSIFAADLLHVMKVPSERFENRQDENSYGVGLGEPDPTVPDPIR